MTHPDTQDAVQPIEFTELDAGAAAPGQPRTLDILMDVEVPVSVEVGGTRLPLREVLRLVPGSVVRLDKKADEPVDLRVNGRLVARGEVVMVEDAYAIRVTRIAEPSERLDALR